jgi:mannosyltransferase OCH1-like enzyme
MYQTWNTNFFGKSHHRAMLTFRNLNPDLNFILYDNTQSDEFMRSFFKGHEILEIYEKARIGPLKTDIFRYCLLYQYGGFYCDINKALTRPFSSFIQRDDTAFITFESNFTSIPPDPLVFSKIMHPDRIILQCILGFQKNHIILQRIIENICEYYPLFAAKKYKRPKDGILAFTGPGMFTKTVRENILSCENLRQIDIDFERSFIFNLPGANVMYLDRIKYGDLKPSEII